MVSSGVDNATVLLLVLFIQIKRETEMASCGRLLPSVTSRIFYGDETHQNYPWHVAIYHRNNETLKLTYQCGGTLISSKSILTAAHCVPVDTQVSVFLGTLSLYEEDEQENEHAQLLHVDEVIVHPNFESTNLKEDIAILTLSTAATLNDYVQPVCLWKSSRKDVSEIIGKSGIVVGWGLTETNRVSKKLHKLTLPVVSWSICLESNPDGFGHLLSDKKFCAGLLNGTGVCKGDSGGSMTFEENGIYYIRGIVSVSASKPDPVAQEIVCDPWKYAIFTDVAHYLPWIRENVKIATADCEAMVRCNSGSQSKTCLIDVQHSSRECKIVLDEVSNAAVLFLFVRGQLDEIPDLSDVAEKFENVEHLHLDNVKLKTVERFKLTPFKGHLNRLNLDTNEIAQLDADTFDDLINLEILELQRNNLIELHAGLFKELHSLKKLVLDNNNLKGIDRDLFAELPNLEQIHLNENQLEILPQGLLRNNKKLVRVYIKNNKIKKIEFSFDDMPNLVIVDLKGNICIDQNCRIYSGCSSLAVMNEKIERNCRN